jgi:hypothetical protein
VVDTCELIDLGFKSHFWTWTKNVVGGIYTRVRMDRAIGSMEWSAQLPLACLSHLEAET